MKVLPRRQALEDLQNAYAFLRADSPSAAEHFLASINAEVELLAAHPFLGRRRHFKRRGIRSWRVRGFEKLLIFYLPTGRALEVIRVLHGAKDVAALL